MTRTVMGPLGLGVIGGVAGATATGVLGGPFLACLAAYSLCGAAGLMGGAALNHRAAVAEDARAAAQPAALPESQRRLRSIAS